MGLSWSDQRAIAATHRPALPEPEQVFLAWLTAQPQDGNLVAAASRELARLARYTGRHPGPGRLRQMFSVLLDELQDGARESGGTIPLCRTGNSGLTP